MKKLLSLFTVLTLMFGLAANTYAADIVVKQVKIKKRNISNIEAGTDRLYHFWADCYDMVVTTTKDTGKSKDQTIFAFALDIDIKKGNKVGSATMDITVMDCNMNIVTKTLTLKPNKDGVYETSYSMSSSEKCGQTLVAADIDLISADGELAPFEAILDKSSDGGKDNDCKGNSKLKEVDFTTDNVSGFYVMSFAFAFDKEIPAGASMLVQLTDCKGNKATVKVKLAYDANTGTAMGTAGIAQVKDCQWTLTYGEIYTIDPCGNEGTWAADFGKVKTSGAGTKTTASTTKSGRPELQ